MKWRKVCPSSRSLSLPDNIPCIPPASVDSTDSFFPSRKPSRSGKFGGLVHGNYLQRPDFLSSQFHIRGSPQPAGLLRADFFFLQIHIEKSRTQVASENGGKWAWPMPGWGPACPKKMPNCSPTAKNAVYEEDELEEEPRSTGELTLWDYRLLKVFFVL